MNNNKDKNSQDVNVGKLNEKAVSDEHLKMSGGVRLKGNHNKMKNKTWNKMTKYINRKRLRAVCESRDDFDQKSSDKQ